jgi:hypothetical protein
MSQLNNRKPLSFDEMIETYLASFSFDENIKEFIKKTTEDALMILMAESPEIEINTTIVAESCLSVITDFFWDTPDIQKPSLSTYITNPSWTIH